MVTCPKCGQENPAAARFWRTAGPSSFVSSHFVTTTERTLAIWALTNTRSLDSANPNLDLRAVVVETQPYHFATIPAVQKKGFHPLGESLNEPVEKLDSGDFRVVSATYSSGRLWATLASQMLDTAGYRHESRPTTSHSVQTLAERFSRPHW